MRITLYSTSSGHKEVTKNLSNETNYVGAFRQGENPSDRDPIIRVSTARNNLTSFNYAYIPLFGAYYFIRDRIAVTAETTELILHKDVLMTYATGIRNQSAIIMRQASSSVADVELQDTNLVVERTYLDAKEFLVNGVRPSLDSKFILAVTGKR